MKVPQEKKEIRQHLVTVPLGKKETRQRLATIGL